MIAMGRAGEHAPALFRTLAPLMARGVEPTKLQVDGMGGV